MIAHKYGQPCPCRVPAENFREIGPWWPMPWARVAILSATMAHGIGRFKASVSPYREVFSHGHHGRMHVVSPIERYF